MTGLAGSVRLLRIEIRHTPAWTLLPVLAALLWIASPYGRTLRAPVVLWSARSVAVPAALQVIGPFAAGVAAWVAAREAQCGTTGLVACTPCPALARRILTRAAGAGVMLAFYALATALIFAVTARQGAWGGPLWWPVAVGALGVVAFNSAGFAIGALLPSRFTAPLLAIGLLFGLQLTLAARFAGQYRAFASPVVDSVDPDAVPFFGAGTGVAVVQALLLAGVIVMTFALPALADAGTRPLARRIVLALTATGLGITVVAVLLAGTATTKPGRGTVIPRFATPAVAAPFTPVCDRAGPIPVCLHPAFRTVLPTVSGDLAAITAQVAGLPGAPDSVEVGTPAAASPADRGALRIPMLNSQGPMNAQQIRFFTRRSATWALVGANPDQHDSATPARVTVADGLMVVAGQTMQNVSAAARRFAALPESTRRAWLAGHLAALQAGTVAPGQLP